ncbi:MAG: hypothetical protein COW30_09480 [Rhodospirillales bacterium CG15_BIG_FIL_POST_REV_8_21_14_020_66_15]|nr:MAG: hypothetical protein COW30_09480 [Rhodospirillales bacterium CG15_BIG_FIL_POST_REV_8_21_14_020_66_15]
MSPLRFVVSALDFLGRHATTMMAVGVFSGLAFPGVTVHLQPWLTHMVWVLMFVSMVHIDWADVMGHIRRPVLLTATLVWMLAVTPVLVWLLVKDSGLSPGLIVAVVLTAASCPLMSTPAVGMVIGLDGAFLLLVLIAETFLVPLTLPVVSATLVDIPLSTLDLMGRLAALVASTFAAAVIAQKILSRVTIDGWRQPLHGVSVLLLVGFAAGLMAGVPDAFQKDPDHVVFVTALSFAVYAGLQLAGVGALVMVGRMPGRDWDRVKVLSVAFASGNRNLAILIAVLLPAIDPDTMLYFVVGQFPIYLMPAVWRQLAKRLLPA